MKPASRRLAALAFAALLALAAPARAETGDREKPINYSADRGDLNYETKIGKLDGNVVVTQGTITVRADRVTFRQNPDNSMQVTASAARRRSTTVASYGGTQPARIFEPAVVSSPRVTI